jgi:concentrative nucleoside transporter, CNT family
MKDTKTAAFDQKSFEQSVQFNDFKGIQEDDLAFKPRYWKRSTKSLLIDGFIWTLLTAYAIALFIRGRGKNGFEFAVIGYVFISLRIFARHFSVSQIIYTPICNAWDATVGRIITIIPQKLRVPIMFAVTFVGLVISAVSFPLNEGGSMVGRFQSLFGVVALLVLMYATSNNRKAIPWHTVSAGLLIQFLIALFVLRTKFGFNIFNGLSKLIVTFLDFSATGATFLIGPYVANNFVLSVVPAIVC